MQSLDAQSVATLLPAAAASLGVTPLELSLAIASYFAGAAACLPLSGWCADRFGARRVFQWAIVGFMLGALISCFALDATMFIGGRVIQGAAGAGLLPIGRLILIRTSEPGELIRRLTWLTLPPLLGPMMGPALAGTFATYVSWRASFLIAVPLGLLGYALVGRFVPDLEDPGRPALDAAGAVYAGTGLAAAVGGLGQLASAGMTPSAVALVLLAAVCVLGYAWHARRTERPILDIRLLRIPTFNVGVLGGAPFRLAVAAEPFLLALLFQIGLGMSAALSGLLVASSALGALVTKSAAPYLIERYGFRRLMLVNGALCALLGAVPAAFDREWALTMMAGVLLVRSCFRSLQLTALNAITYADAPPDRISAASSLAATMQQLAQAFSIAAAAGLVRATSLFTPQATPHYSVSVAFIVLSAVSLLALPLITRLPGDAGASISGHRRTGRN